MARDYRLADGTRPISASEVAKLLGDPEHLLRWAVHMHRHGMDPFAYRDEAAETGTAVHAAIAARLTGQAPEPHLWGCTDVRGAEHAFAAWLRWWESETRPTPTLIEQPIVSETYRLAGTPDLVAGRELYDWKGCATLSAVTGKTKRSVYRDSHALQCALYALLVADAGHPLPTVARIVYLPRDAGDAIEVALSGAIWTRLRREARSLLRVVRGHLERTKHIADWARPMPRPEPVDLDAPIAFDA